MSVPSLVLLPEPRTGYYEWNGSKGRQRETYTILGFATTEPEKNEAAHLYHATWLLVEREDHRLTWLGMGQLTLASTSTEGETPA